MSVRALERRNDTLWFCIPLLIIGLVGCNLIGEQNDPWSSYHDSLQKPPPSVDELTLSPPEAMDYFPCNDCHGFLEVNPKRRDLVEMHDDIIFNHDSEHRWCLDCHDESNRDSLRLANGRLIGFDKSYELCGQCHGPKFRDWRYGIHGKRSGEWNGDKIYIRCIHCHDPHSPKFKAMEPMPPPFKPLEIKYDSLIKPGNINGNEDEQ